MEMLLSEWLKTQYDEKTLLQIGFFDDHMVDPEDCKLVSSGVFTYVWEEKAQRQTQYFILSLL